MKRSTFLTAAAAASVPAPALAQLSSGSDAIRLRFVPDEARAVLAVLTARGSGTAPTEAQWNILFASEGYRRLAERERSFKRPFDDETFRAFVLGPDLLARRDALAGALEAWSRADVSLCGKRALAYLPSGSTLRASVYPEIKPQRNSFVYDLERDPGIFLFLDPEISATQFTYTVAHELHHVGFSQNCPTPAVRAELALLPAHLQLLQRWLSGFGEGFAVLAGAGGPDVAPENVVGIGAAPEWRTERETFAARIGELSAFFRRILSGELVAGDAAREAGMAFFGNQGAWYTVGWRMAVTIERRFGRARLIECIADNREFLSTYNAAAAGTTLPRWDDELAGAFKRPA